MDNVLLITSSPRGEQSYSTRVANDLAQRLGGQLTVRELWRRPLAPIGPDFLQAISTPEDQRSDMQRTLILPSEQVIDELLAADTIVIGAGMINFSLPATLKTWIDYVVRAGVTFRYGQAGPEGLLNGKRAILVLATGGVYTEHPMNAFDYLGPVLRAQLSFLGITNVTTIPISGTMLGESSAETAITLAAERVRELTELAHVG